MTIEIKLTTTEYINAIRNAITTDDRWPRLCTYDWLIEHAHIRDGEVKLTIKD